MNTSTAQKTLLVIEDEPDILFSLTAFLESEGYRVVTAQNGQEGLDFLERNPLPSLILLDMKMPIMDGWKFSEEFKKRFANRCPVVVMTAAADAGERAHEAHANGWLGKPFSLEEITSQINKFLGNN